MVIAMPFSKMVLFWDFSEERADTWTNVCVYNPTQGSNQGAIPGIHIPEAPGGSRGRRALSLFSALHIGNLRAVETVYLEMVFHGGSWGGTRRT